MRVLYLGGDDTMTMQENANLVKLLRAIGLGDKIGDFILGIEGSITIEEAAKKITEKEPRN